MESNDTATEIQGIDPAKVRQTRGFLVIADISGYTRFVLAHKGLPFPALRERSQRVSEEHAEAIVTMLLETVIEGLDGILTINKLEGDAALFYALSEEPEEFASRLLPKLLEVFENFNQRLEALWECNGCFCEACCKRGDLRIKVLAHYGEFMVKRVSRFEELAGEALIFIHRLLKNEVPSDEYLLLTEALSSLLPGNSEWQRREQQVDDFGCQPVWVCYPGAPQVKARGLRPPWPWEYIAMNKLFEAPDRRVRLEQKIADVLVGGALGGATPGSLLESR